VLRVDKEGLHEIDESTGTVKTLTGAPWSEARAGPLCLAPVTRRAGLSRSLIGETHEANSALRSTVKLDTGSWLRAPWDPATLADFSPLTCCKVVSLQFLGAVRIHLEPGEEVIALRRGD
jgi:hypothetical protein